MEYQRITTPDVSNYEIYPENECLKHIPKRKWSNINWNKYCIYMPNPQIISHFKFRFSQVRKVKNILQ